MNSGQFTGRSLDALVSKLSASPGRSPEDVASDLFLSILSRRPSTDEARQVKSYLTRSTDTHAGCRELEWVLVMTSEFSLNH